VAFWPPNCGADRAPNDIDGRRDGQCYSARVSLSQFAQAFVVVDQDGSSVARVRLLVDGETWHTWTQDELGQTWVERAGEQMNAIAEQLPSGTYTAEFVAEDRAGGARQRMQTQLGGRQARLSKRKGEETALSGAVESITRTVRQLLELQEGTLRLQQQQLERALTAQAETLAKLEEQRESGLSGGVVEQMVREFVPQLGPILEVLPDVMKAYAQSRRSPPVQGVPMPGPRRAV
jgi:hypothetical protein